MTDSSAGPERPDRLLPLNPRDFMLLLILAEGPAHGYGIVKDAEARFGDAVRLDPANLHRSVLRLMRDGVVRDAESPPEDASEQRRYFEITPFGRAVVSAEADRLAALTEAARTLSLIR